MSILCLWLQLPAVCVFGGVRYQIVPRVLRATESNPETTMLGHRIAFPVCVAPSAYHRLIHPLGEIATARGVHSRHAVCLRLIFTARCYASAVLAMGLCPPVCLCLSVSLSVSVTSRCSTKTAKRRITQTTPHDTSGTLVFGCQRSPRNSTGVTPYGGAKCSCGGSKSATFHK